MTDTKEPLISEEVWDSMFSVQSLSAQHRIREARAIKARRVETGASE